MSEDRARGEREGLLGSRETTIVLAAYGIGLLAAPMLLYPLLAYLERECDTFADAVGAFITICVIGAGLPPIVIIPFLIIGRAWTLRSTTRRFALPDEDRR